MDVAVGYPASEAQKLAKTHARYCSEWGFFQATNAGPHALGSRYQDAKHQQELCYRQFPDGLSSGHLPREPHVDKMNRMFGGWFLRPSNTFYTGGEFDP